MARNPLWHRFWEADDHLEPEGPATLRKLGIYPLLALVVLVLGFNWPVLAIGLRDLSPMWMAVMRLTGGTLAVFVVAAISGRLRPPDRRDLPVVISVAVLRLSLAYLMVFTALQIIPPGRSSVLVWTASLWAVPMAALVLDERMTPLRWAGLALGIGGVVILIEPWRMTWSEPGVIVGHLLLLGAAVLNAAASVHIRHHSWASTPFTVIPWQLLIATLPVALLALITEGVPDIEWTGQLAAVVAYQGVLATGLVLWAQVSVQRSLPAVSTNLSLMLVPVVGLISSALVLGEVITATVVSSVVLIFVGVTLNLGADREI